MTKHYRHFKHLHIPDGWEQYWSKYPNGYSLMEALINWVGQVNDMVDVSNETTEQVNCLQRNFNALDKELRASWKGYKDSTTKKYEDFRDEVHTIINNWIATIEPTIQDTVVSSLQTWLLDGTLADIINQDVFDMKANQTDLDETNAQLAQTNTDIDEVATQLAQTNTDIDEVATQLAQANTDIEVIKHKQSQYVSVSDFGAKGDGVTDDTEAVQSAIDSLIGSRDATIMFPPTNGAGYKLGQIVIPSSIVVVTFQGVGNCTILLNDPVVFSIKTENLFFKDIIFKGVHSEIRNDGAVVFKDDRDYRALDFDLNLIGCRFDNVHSVVSTKGRGVYIDGCHFMSIPGRIIKIEVLPKSQVDEGNEEIQNYQNGYRVYVIKNSRFHYLTGAVMIQTYNDIEKVVNGVCIEGNYIEGGLSYFVGYVKDFVFQNNQHYNNTYPWGSLFNFAGVENAYIDIQMTGSESPAKYTQVINCDGDALNLVVKGYVKGLRHHCVVLRGNSKFVYIDLSVTGVVKVGFSPFLFSTAGNNTTHTGLSIKGIFEGTDTTRSLIKDEGTGNTFEHVKLDLLGVGEFSYVSDGITPT